MEVSIHAPAKGATYANQLRGEWSCLFQSTPPRRGRLIACVRQLHQSKSFNPRPREGGDLCECSLCPVILCFNPRPREGGDMSSYLY